MKKQIAFVAAGISLCLGTAHAASTARGTYTLQLAVPETCTVRHSPGLMPAGADSYSLGALQEYCNSPRGYNVVVSYEPGTMRGARLTLGGDTVVLNGSGTAVISHAPGPRILNRELVATAGEAGFDTDRLTFEAIAN